MEEETTETGDGYMTRHLIIDGDAIAYRSACAVVHTYWVTEEPPLADRVVWPKGTIGKNIPEVPGMKKYQETEAEPVEHALQIAKTYFTNIFGAVRDQFNEDFDVSVFLTSQDKSDPRYKIAKTKGYKANRKSDKPIYLDAVRDYIIKRAGGIVVEGMEADDAVSITAHTYATSETIIAGVDKDLYQIRGHHYDIAKRKWMHVDVHQAAINFYTQMLTGDTSDNVPGIKGLGKAKAQKEFQKAFVSFDKEPTICDYHRATKGIYKYYGHDEEYFLEQGQLLYLRHTMEDIWDGEVFRINSKHESLSERPDREVAKN